MAPRTPPKPKTPKHTQWEVKTVGFTHTDSDENGRNYHDVDDSPEPEANALGAEGWEPVAFYRGADNGLVGVFKRPKL